MSESPLVSIVINNYNYGRFLAEAIDSALNQTYPNIEVIVVDDGSTDQSRDVIATYGNQIIPVLKENGGQGSAFNAGFRTSSGKVIIFLDSDDALLPSAVEAAIPFFQDPKVSKVHWPLWTMDEESQKNGRVFPSQTLPEGNLQEVVRRSGPWGYVTPPTSGNAWSRWFLEGVLPMPEIEYRICADAYLFALAPVMGRFQRLVEPQALYRLHGKNNHWGKPFEEKLRQEIEVYDQQCRVLSQWFFNKGISINVEDWKKDSWLHQLKSSVEEILSLISPGQKLILVDGDEWGVRQSLDRRQVTPFIERDGQYWGPPPDDESAVSELERLRQSGANFIVFGWPGFWWLEHFALLHRHLRSNFRCVLENERLIVFDLRDAS